MGKKTMIIILKSDDNVKKTLYELEEITILY